MFACESVVVIRNAVLKDSNSMCASGCAFSDTSAFGIKSYVFQQSDLT